ncbi:MAG: methylenetetrahydrofolate reductase [Dehalococcoidia bacterium]|nr:methylenetetrahydrofolate reductase [Dehalococcoidia bacterium]
MTITTPRSVSRLAADLAAGRFAVTGEVVPPATARLGAFLRRAEAMSRFCRAITVTNNHGGNPRLGSLTASGFLVRRGIEPIWICVTRDQNRVALQSDIISADAMGIRNMVCLAGDSHDAAERFTPVKDVTTLGLIRMAATYRDQGGPLFIGAALDLNSVSAEKAAEQAARRADAGAEFLLTQPVYEPDRVKAFLEAARRRIDPMPHLIVGMMPLLSKDAVARVPARLRIVIADHILRRIAEADDPKAEGLLVFAETLTDLRSVPGVSGVNLMLFGFDAGVASLLAGIVSSVQVASGLRMRR